MDDEVLGQHRTVSTLNGFKKEQRTPHYELWPETEAIDVIQSALTPEEFKGYLKGNVLKYKLRVGDKPDQDVDKEIAKSHHYRSLLRHLMGD